MSGVYVCALIPVPESGSPQPPKRCDVLPCREDLKETLNDILILGILNERDRTLHVRIG